MLITVWCSWDSHEIEIGGLIGNDKYGLVSKVCFLAAHEVIVYSTGVEVPRKTAYWKCHSCSGHTVQN